jgi:hypothetical protein
MRAEPPWHSFPSALDRSRPRPPDGRARDALWLRSRAHCQPQSAASPLVVPVEFGHLRIARQCTRDPNSDACMHACMHTCMHTGVRWHSKRGLCFDSQECMPESCSNGPDPICRIDLIDNWSGRRRWNKLCHFLLFKVWLFVQFMNLMNSNLYVGGPNYFLQSRSFGFSTHWHLPIPGDTFRQLYTT